MEATAGQSSCVGGSGADATAAWRGVDGVSVSMGLGMRMGMGMD